MTSRFLAATVLLTGSGLALRSAPATPPAIADIYSGKAREPYYAFQTTWIAPADSNYQRRSEASAVILRNGNVLVAWCDLVGRSGR